MKTNRNGKIARLPRTIRDELSQRIDNGQPGPKITAWLNALPEVQTVLTEHFAGRPINRQNLTEWRQGGFQEWFELQEKRKLTREIVGDTQALAADHSLKQVGDALAILAANELLHTTHAKLKACTDTNQRWEIHGQIQDRLFRLRRDQFRADSLKLRQDRWDYKVAADERAAKEAAKLEEYRQHLARFELYPQIPERAKKYGNTDEHLDIAASLLEAEHNLKRGLLTRRKPIPGVIFEVDPISTGTPGGYEPGTPYPAPDPEGQVPPVPNTAPDSSNPSDTSAPTPQTPDASPQTPKTPEIRVNQATSKPDSNCPRHPISSLQPHPTRCLPSDQSSPENTHRQYPTEADDTLNVLQK